MAYYQLTCTIVSLILNTCLIYLIWTKSPIQTGNYKYLMIYTAVFETFWGLFDLPAAISNVSVGSAFVVFRVNTRDSWLSHDQSSWIVVVYTAIFGASMAIFASHFAFRFGSIDSNFGKRFTSGKKFHLLFVYPLFYFFWWGAVVSGYFWQSPELEEYTRDFIMEEVGVEMRDISYIGTKFYNYAGNGSDVKFFNASAWIGIGQLWFMVISSMMCVFGFGTLCYHRLSSQLSACSVSIHTNALQKQLFYALVAQTAIPIFLMHIPIALYFLCPMFDTSVRVVTDVVVFTISLYPAVDPLPIFCIVKNYRLAVTGMWVKLLNNCW